MDEIEAVIATWYAALEAGDADAAAALLAPEAVMMPPGAPSLAGRDAIADALASFLARNEQVSTFTVKAVTRETGLAVVRVQESATVRERGDDQAQELRGKHLFTLRYSAGEGDWRILMHMVNLDGPPRAITVEPDEALAAAE